MGPTWGPPGSCRPQMGPMLAPWTLLSGAIWKHVNLGNAEKICSTVQLIFSWPCRVEQADSQAKRLWGYSSSGANYCSQSATWQNVYNINGLTETLSGLQKIFRYNTFLCDTIYIYIYQMDCVCQRYHKECSTRTCADDCYNCWHYGDVIMGTMASQITSLTIVYSTVYSGEDHIIYIWRKYLSSATLAFVRGIHRYRWIPRTNGQLRGKCFHLITSSWKKSKLKSYVRPCFHGHNMAASMT